MLNWNNGYLLSKVYRFYRVLAFQARKKRFDFIRVMVAVYHSRGGCHSYHYFRLYHFTEKSMLPPLWVNLSPEDSKAMGYITTRGLESDTRDSD
jgi:hypothetical protein